MFDDIITGKKKEKIKETPIGDEWFAEYKKLKAKKANKTTISNDVVIEKDCTHMVLRPHSIL